VDGGHEFGAVLDGLAGGENFVEEDVGLEGELVDAREIVAHVLEDAVDFGGEGRCFFFCDCGRDRDREGEGG